ncbi:RNA 2',3'-cyclic phosphodiesterase [Streptomyces sp. YIM 130001]|uniref:RNA 2',3'-cyclic phosphodiesterase n=1 Tax=Streptomyces sp. YIM 130001 TaxID=2259644 RepID=UPI000E647AEC|nr:RNA 2',3'-cyclic phosphodiesterase [Streptomyces sp. YIM 130001]
MRLFVAVLPPEAAADELAAEMDGLRALPGADGLRWTEWAGWHFTLAFLGEVPEGVLPGLDSRLARAAGRTAPFPLALRGGGSFGDRALWAGAGGDHGALRRLAERVEVAAREAGVDDREDPYGFRPHLTLARAAGRGTSLAPFVEALGPFRGSSWTVARLSLVRSHLPRRGVRGERPRYEEVGHWALGGDG